MLNIMKLCVLLLGVIWSGASVSAVNASALPPHARSAPVHMILSLYSEKTWVWAKGAGYFAPNLKFVAWSGTRRRIEYIAAGRWFVTPKGTMCFQAVWRGGDVNPVEKRTCFDHRIDAGLVYQRRAPRGMWYEFKPDAPAPGYRLRQLTSGDLVSAKMTPLDIGIAR